MIFLVSQFLEAIQAEQNASENTLQSYGRDLKRFTDFAKKKGLTEASTTSADIAAYMESLEAEGLAAASRARALSALKQFFRFLYEENIRSDNPAIRMKGPGKAKSLPKTLSIEEVDRLLSAASETGRNDTDKRRNQCLIQLLYATGMRASELVSLPLEAVLGNPEMLLIKGKGGKERVVPLSPPARMALAAYLKDRKEQDTTSPFLFPSNSKDGHLTRIRFYTLIKEFAVTAGISPAKVSPHVVRHAFATHLLSGGADLRVIQILLGHADIATTEIYTHVMDEELKALVFEHHPLA